MAMQDQPSYKFNRKTSLFITFISPFRLVLNDALDNYKIGIDEINNRTYDYVKLHSLVGTFPIDTEFSELVPLFVGFDGLLAIPAYQEFKTIDVVVKKFNEELGKIMIGGVLCDAITLNDVGHGIAYPEGYIRALSNQRGSATRLHMGMRTMDISSFDAIVLHDAPQINVRTLEKAHDIGQVILKKLPHLSVDMIAQGVTYALQRDWGTALANLWAPIEQIVHHFWREHIINPSKSRNQGTMSRIKFLSDVRTWTMSTKCELLFQLNILDASTYDNITLARKARNNFFHRGERPTANNVLSAYRAVIGMIKYVMGEDQFPLAEIDLEKSIQEDPFSVAPEHSEPRPVEEMRGMWSGPWPPIPCEDEWKGTRWKGASNLKWFEAGKDE